MHNLHLPDGNGVETCRRLKSDGELCGIPILLMSAAADKSESLARSNAEDFISKPFDLMNLKDRVQLYVSSQVPLVG